MLEWTKRGKWILLVVVARISRFLCLFVVSSLLYSQLLSSLYFSRSAASPVQFIIWNLKLCLFSTRSKLISFGHRTHRHVGHTGRSDKRERREREK